MQCVVVVTDKSFLLTKDGGSTWTVLAPAFHAPDAYHQQNYYGWDPNRKILYAAGLGPADSSGHGYTGTITGGGRPRQNSNSGPSAIAKLALENRRRMDRNEFVFLQDELRIEAIAARIVNGVAAKAAVKLVFVIVIKAEI